MSWNQEASRADAEAFAQGLKRSHLICRSYSHAKVPSIVRVVQLEGSRKKYYEQTLTCRNRCGVKWRLLIDMTTGIVVHRRMDYSGAKGYLAQGIGRINEEGRGAIRLQAIISNFSEEETE